MNSPQPVPVAATNLAPTLGSALGGAIGLVAANKLGLNPLEATGGSVVMAITALITAAVHWLGIKTGIPGLS